MNRISLFRNNRFMLRIYLFVFIAFFILVTVFSAIVFNWIGNMVLDNEYKNNMKILTQLKNNVEFMDNTVRNICQYLHISDNVIFIMYDDNPDITGLVTEINKLRNSIISANPFVHSLYIYNRHYKGFYSTYKGLYYNDPILAELIKDDNIPKLKPIMRRIEPEYTEQKGTGYVFTYLMYERNKDNAINDMLVVNVKPEWLIDNINNIFSNKPGEGEFIFIFNNKGEYIGNNSGNPDFDRTLREVYNEYSALTSEGKREMEYIVKKVGNEDYMYSFLFIEKLDMLLVKTQKYNALFNFTNRIRYSIILMTGAIIILSLVILFYLSRFIYKPVGNLVNQVASHNPKKEIVVARDEITYLSNVYTNIIEGLNSYENQILTIKDEMKKKYLKKLLNGSFDDDMSKFQTELESNYVRVRTDRPMLICVVAIDDFNDFKNKYNARDRGLLKFCVVNICEEIISADFPVNGVDMEDSDKVVLLLNADNAGTDYGQRLNMLLADCQQKICEYLKFTVTITVSRLIDNPREINEEYIRTLHNSSYKYIYGRNSIITPEMVEANIRNSQNEIPIELRKKLEEEIKGGNMARIEKVLDRIINEMSRLEYNSIIVSSMLIFNIIKNTADETNRVRLTPVTYDLSTVSSKIIGAETLDDFKKVVLDSLKNVIELRDSVGIDDRHKAVIEKIKEIIKKEYSSSNLCIDEIAARLKMSSKYVGRIFKESMRMTVSEYINDVRMNIAAELLRSTNLSVVEISMKVGIENDTYFYSLFKKKHGVTPKEYAVKAGGQAI